ncbi:MAG: DUF488 domain-containing protein [Alphaproteobacteria bacterium]|nr:DUF488 domain-containing protein [Alphaproteobacteria bacterium]
MSARTLYTVGYEGADLSDFLITLQIHKIKQVIDVRDLPLSRKRGFSKNALAAALADLDIAYLHLKSLGDPKPGREAARNGDTAGFRRIYSRHLSGNAARAGLIEATTAARKTTSSLLCYERDHSDCHRAIIAEKLKSEFTVHHITVTLPVTKRQKSANDHTTGSLAYG